MEFCNTERADRLAHPVNCVVWDEGEHYCDTLSVGSRDDRRDCFETLLLPEVHRDARKAAGPEEWAQDVIQQAMVAVCTQSRPIRELVPYFIKAVANGAGKARRGAWAPNSSK